MNRMDIIQFSRRDHLDFFWKLYWKRQKTKNRYMQDILDFFIARSASKHGGYIGKDARIDEELKLPHGLHGIYISRYAHIGRNCWMYQNVTVGEVNGKAPDIGDDVLIGAGAVLVGDIKIGNRVKIGAGAVVFEDVPDDCTVVAQPCRVIPHKKTDSRQ